MFHYSLRVIDEQKMSEIRILNLCHKKAILVDIYRQLLLRWCDEIIRKRGNHWNKQNQHLKTPKRWDAPCIVTNTQEGRVRVRMLPPTVAQKNGNDFQIIFAHHIFL